MNYFWIKGIKKSPAEDQGLRKSRGAICRGAKPDEQRWQQS